jgi:hypothetical protein
MQFLPPDNDLRQQLYSLLDEVNFMPCGVLADLTELTTAKIGALLSGPIRLGQVEKLRDCTCTSYRMKPHAKETSLS